MKFINRRKELEFLEKKYRSSKAELIILYGRRRIGKTELISRFCSNKKSAYFLGRLESKEDTIRRFNSLLIESFKDTAILNNPLKSWDNIFDYLGEKKERVILVIDEFPFVAERSPEVISVLQDKWDSKLKNTKIMLVLLGSSVSMMEKYALDYQSPLYGRRTGQWKIDKLDVIHLSGFFPKYKAEDIIVLYSCLDTIPGYLNKFEANKSVISNIKEKILSKGEFLYEEVEILLREEFRDPSNYTSILAAIASGMTTFNEIYNKIVLDKSLLSKYLYVLENLGIIQKIMPINKNYKKKLKFSKSLYYLKDNFFGFWFRFVYSNKQEIERGNINYALDYLSKNIDGYVSLRFENFISELLPFMDIGMDSINGKWWHKDKEIDIVALNEQKKEILFAECKWQNKVNAENVINDLIEKSKYVDWHNESRKESFAVFAKSFIKKIKEFDGKKVHCFDLRDIKNSIKK